MIDYTEIAKERKKGKKSNNFSTPPPYLKQKLLTYDLIGAWNLYSDHRKNVSVFSGVEVREHFPAPLAWN